MQTEPGSDPASFLSRVRAALARTRAAAPGEETAITPASLAERAERIRAEAAGRWEELLSRFTAELEAVGGTVHRADASAVLALVARIARARRLSRLVTWSESALGLPGLAGRLRAGGLEVVDASLHGGQRETPESVQGIRTELERGEIGLTGVDYAVADTGSLVLWSGPGKGRLVSSLPVVHVAILRPGQLLGAWEDVGVLLEALHRQAPPTSSPSAITFITGPSRTADIGLSLTRGAHGPKEVHVIALA